MLDFAMKVSQGGEHGFSKRIFCRRSPAHGFTDERHLGHRGDRGVLVRLSNRLAKRHRNAPER